MPHNWMDISQRFLKQTVYDNEFIKFGPNSAQQAMYLSLPCTEALYGGAAGGGKSYALLMAALMYVAVPGYHAMLFRRTLQDLRLPDALIPMSHQWLSDTKAHWNGSTNEWTFPSGATLTFGYCNDENDKFRYQGAQLQFIGFDELTQFTLTQYTYILSRMRKKIGVPVLLRARTASNPGGIGHEWVRDRFVFGNNRERPFIPARLEDNRDLDKESYERSLELLDPVTRAQLRHGDWRVRPEGNMFKRAWFKRLDEVPTDLVRSHRHWDLAATPVTQANKDPDWAAGCRMARRLNGRFVIIDMRHVRESPLEVEECTKSAASMDGGETTITIEQEPGSSGKAICDHYSRNVLLGYNIRGVPPIGDKTTRAGPFSAACEKGLVDIVRGAWNEAFLDELVAFPGDIAHDDQVDAASGCFNEIAGFGMMGDHMRLGDEFLSVIV